MKLADVVQAMAAAGCSAEQIAAVSTSLDTRSTGAKRQARYRERLRNKSVTWRNKSVTVTSPLRSSVTPPLPPDKERSPIPPKEINPPPLSLFANATSESSEPSVSDKKHKKNQYPSDFETFWRAYPTHANMSKQEALHAWQRLDAEDREKATRSVPAFRVYCGQHPDYTPVHAERYLKYKRFDGFAEIAQRTASSEGVFVKIDTPQWDAWSAYLRAKEGRAPPIDSKGGWRFPSEWPPEKAARA